jgi:hypothetical protein
VRFAGVGPNGNTPGDEPGVLRFNYLVHVAVVMTGVLGLFLRLVDDGRLSSARCTTAAETCRTGSSVHNA